MAACALRGLVEAEAPRDVQAVGRDRLVLL
jgi:hypothetical protein